jgi:hypothetical protein
MNGDKAWTYKVAFVAGFNALFWQNHDKSHTLQPINHQRFEKGISSLQK